MEKRCRLESIPCAGLTHRICPTRGNVVIYSKSKPEHYFAVIYSPKVAPIIRPSRRRISSSRAKSSARPWTTIRIQKTGARCWKDSLHSDPKPLRVCTEVHGEATAQRCCELSGIDYLDSQIISSRVPSNLFVGHNGIRLVSHSRLRPISFYCRDCCRADLTSPWKDRRIRAAVVILETIIWLVSRLNG